MNHLSPLSSTHYEKQNVCEAGNSPFLRLCVGVRLPVPAILIVNCACRVCVRVCVYEYENEFVCPRFYNMQMKECVCLCVSTCVHKKEGPAVQSMPKTKPSFSLRWNFLLRTHMNKYTHAHTQPFTHFAPCTQLLLSCQLALHLCLLRGQIVLDLFDFCAAQNS